MKILAVSLSFSSKNVSTNFEHHFFYTAREFKPARKKTENFNIVLGALALLAVSVALLNIGVGKRIPKKVFVV